MATSFSDRYQWPDAHGHFGPYGGMFVPETLMQPLEELRAAYERYLQDEAFLAELDGSCRTPIAGHAVADGDMVRFKGMILKPDGSEVHEIARDSSRADAVETGAACGRHLKELGGPDFFADI